MKANYGTVLRGHGIRGAGSREILQFTETKGERMVARYSGTHSIRGAGIGGGGCTVPYIVHIFTRDYPPP